MEDPEPVRVEGIPPEVFVRLDKDIFPDTDLDGDLPVGRWADPLLVRGVHYGSGRRPAKLRVGQVKPQHRVRVEQQVHGMYSAQSFKCSSSSDTMVSIPLPRPGLGCGFCAGSPTMRATGRLSRVMTTSSPGGSLSMISAR